MTKRLTIVAGVAAAAFALAACDHLHHKEPVVAKGYAPVASVEAPAAVQPAANWK
ncbi:MAG: hypothetical protein H6878_06325 [Rhodobiaceae bacterium]|nr:hypothetical protein [Rhodobiaceae bacterium]MCC0015909.1 hypothetical protein [Rhodobiaceae bacterium]MCC0040694.1 hypothetical protein [Rhodobiaceae bacterium]